MPPRGRVVSASVRPSRTAATISRKTTINLAPADLRKEGSGFDLPMALGILGAYGELNNEPPEDALFVGELSLDGGLRGAGCPSRRRHGPTRFAS